MQTLIIAFLVALLVWTLLVGIIAEIAQRTVMGPWIKESELDTYLGKYYEELRLNQFSHDGTLFMGSPKYVARSFAPSSAWYIEDYGTIPRWSKWHSKLEFKRKELMANRSVTSLGEL